MTRNACHAALLAAGPWGGGHGAPLIFAFWALYHHIGNGCGADDLSRASSPSACHPDPRDGCPSRHPPSRHAYPCSLIVFTCLRLVAGVFCRGPPSSSSASPSTRSTPYVGKTWYHHHQLLHAAGLALIGARSLLPLDHRLPLSRSAFPLSTVPQFAFSSPTWPGPITSCPQP